MAKPSTLHTYALALRRIASGVTGRRNDDSIRLDAIPPSAVKVWRNNYVREKGINPAARGRAIITTNSLIRNARALFAKKHLEDLRALVNLPPVGKKWHAGSRNLNPGHSTTLLYWLLGALWGMKLTPNDISAYHTLEAIAHRWGGCSKETVKRTARREGWTPFRMGGRVVRYAVEEVLGYETRSSGLNIHPMPVPLRPGGAQTSKSKERPA